LRRGHIVRLFLYLVFADLSDFSIEGKKYGRVRKSKSGSGQRDRAPDEILAREIEDTTAMQQVKLAGNSRGGDEKAQLALGQELNLPLITRDTRDNDVELLPLITSPRSENQSYNTYSKYALHLSLRNLSNNTSFPTPSPLTDILLLPSTSAITALLHNASLLSIPCSPSPRHPGIHLSPQLTYPPALTPTPLQLTTPHLPYIPLLPFPSLRQKLLLAGSLVPSEELWDDFTRGDIRVWGSTPWESTGWEIGERFARKWWWVLDQGVLDRANFWRAVRGERALRIEDVVA
jgi:Domain of unknown function (DUF3425)